MRAENVLQRRGFFAGHDDQRIHDLNLAFIDPAVRGIFCARGGSGSLRILDRIDVNAVRENPKVFLGFSDITAIHSFLFRETGLVTFSGPMPAGTQISEMTVEHQEHYKRLLTQADDPGTVPGKGRPVVSGSAKGRLLGGNLTLLVHCAAAGKLANLRGAVLLIEDVNEPAYRIDRALTALEIGGHLEGISGILGGEFPGIEDPRVDAMIQERADRLGVPAIAGFPIGHGKANVAVPLGCEVFIDADRGTLTLEEPAVC